MAYNYYSFLNKLSLIVLSIYDLIIHGYLSIYFRLFILMLIITLVKSFDIFTKCLSNTNQFLLILWYPLIIDNRFQFPVITIDFNIIFIKQVLHFNTNIPITTRWPFNALMFTQMSVDFDIKTFEMWAIAFFLKSGSKMSDLSQIVIFAKLFSFILAGM